MRTPVLVGKSGVAAVRWRRTSLIVEDPAAGGRPGCVATGGARPAPAGHRDHRRRLSRAIHETASLAQTARFPDAVIGHVTEQLTGLLDLQACRFEYGSLLGHPAAGIRRHRHDGPWTLERGAIRAARRGGRAAYLRHGQYFGRFMMAPKPGSKPSLPARLVAVTLADQAGRALAGRQPARTAH